MIRIQTAILDKVKNATQLDQLHEFLQYAIELEHSTIPPYLTAMISLKPEKNREIWNIIHSVVVEEMLHMTIAANILNALKGKPVVNKEGFVPAYPGPLPLGIRDGLIVGLEAYSTRVVKDVFMEIEEPENPLNFPVKSAAADNTYATIGLFYKAIQEKIAELADHHLPGNPKYQVTGFFDEDLLFPIKTKQQAIAAIDIIVEQGEGTETSPLDGEDELAHYYLFAELYHGKRLVKDGSSFSYSGAPIPFDAAAVYPLAPNTKVADLPAGSEARRRAHEFNVAYSKLLNALHRTYNGEPDFVKHSIGLMFDVKLKGERLAEIPFPGKAGFTVGPPFEFVDVTF
ncbi:ferritin-like domain-containing protein [Chitinophaga solisilvae]|uniref:ferritin-like domain-containing protein n=1 Tax=Chitinophaga solisilvae TaxID=1233460 RepID=UPI00136D4D6B|nr:ferritin-like protein [Chitinophaga solisilvae]